MPGECCAPGAGGWEKPGAPLNCPGSERPACVCGWGPPYGALYGAAGVAPGQARSAWDEPTGWRCLLPDRLTVRPVGGGGIPGVRCPDDGRRELAGEGV